MYEGVSFYPETSMVPDWVKSKWVHETTVCDESRYGPEDSRGGRYAVEFHRFLTIG